MGRANRLQVTFAARLFIRKNPNASDERAAERRHRQSEGTDAYLPDG